MSTLSLSQKNQQYLVEKVDYYGANLKRQTAGTRLLSKKFSNSCWIETVIS